MRDLGEQRRRQRRGDRRDDLVGLIGSGWYGKCDLLRLIQVAPVEVVSLCDVDSKMLSEAADIVSTRQVSNVPAGSPRLSSELSRMR